MKCLVTRAQALINQWHTHNEPELHGISPEYRYVKSQSIKYGGDSGIVAIISLISQQAKHGSDVKLTIAFP